MSEPNYTVKEIIELQFNALRLDLQEIKSTLKDQNLQTERRFTKVEKELEDLKLEVARYKVVWGVVATVGASVIAFTLNKFLP
jgi:hypothetical protein